MERSTVLTAASSLLLLAVSGVLGCPCTCWHPTEDGQTLIVDCTSQGLDGAPAEWPTHPAHLVASFSHNNMTRLHKMPHTDAVTIALTFSHCGISTLDTGLFTSAINIGYLDLSWNSLTGDDIPADVFRGAYSNNQYETIALSELHLDHNNIESLGHRTFEHTPNLTVLRLDHNPLQVLDQSTCFAISSLVQLKILNLASTSLSTLPDGLLSRLRTLTELDLSYNMFVTVPESVGFVAGSLEKLNLDGNPIVELNDESFLGLDKLREVRISNMGALVTINHNTFSNLAHMRTLHCSNNPKLSRIHERAFGLQQNRPPIKELYINDNDDLAELSDELLHWTDVKVVQYEGNHWPRCQCETKAPWCQHIALCRTNWAQDIDNIDMDDTHRSPQSSISKKFIITIPILLCIIAGVFFWRVLIKYRDNRNVNIMYPVMYISAPTTET